MIALCISENDSKIVYNRDDAKYLCGIVHVDLIAFMPPTFVQGNKYCLTVLNNHIRYLQILKMKFKTEVAISLDKTFVNLKTLFHSQYRFEYLQCNNVKCSTFVESTLNIFKIYTF